MSDFGEEENFPEDEEFGDEEYIIDDDDDADDILPDDCVISEDIIQRQPERSEAEQKKQSEIQELMGRFNPTSTAARRLINDLYEMMHTDPNELGFRTSIRGNDIFSWEVQVFGFDPKDKDHKDIVADMEQYKRQSGRDYIEMAVTFPPTYPDHPPFVRVVQPRFMFHTGRVTVGGSLCTDILTSEGWKPIYDIQSLMVNIFSEIINGKPRIDFSNQTPYSLDEAKAAFQRVASDHGWKINKWLPNK